MGNSPDLWWESRMKSAAFRGQPIERALSFVSQSLPGRPTRETVGMSLVGYDKAVMMVDLNVYRPDVNVEMLIDQGVKLFGLRVWGPSNWVYGNWQYKVDPTFVGYYERIRKKDPNVWILGYAVHNAWSNEEGNYLGPDPQVMDFKVATRNQPCDLYCWDDEVATCWKNGKETQITATNLVKSIRIAMDQTLKEFEKWPNGYPKIPVHYSACWFMKQYALSAYQTWKDQAAKDPNNRPFLNWYAYLPHNFTETWQTVGQLFDKLPTPTGTQENAYLKMGSEPATDLWQCTFSGKGPWNSTTGIDMSISYGPSKTVPDFARNANLLNTQAPPPDDGNPPPVDPTIEGRVKALEDAVWTLKEDRVKNITVQIERGA